MGLCSFPKPVVTLFKANICNFPYDIEKNLKSHRILKFYFPDLESHEIEVCVMESHGKEIH